MFREQYKADNEKIRPSEEKLKSLAMLMQQEIDKKDKYEKEYEIELPKASTASDKKEKTEFKLLPKRYRKPAAAMVSMAASLAIIIGLLNVNPTVNPPFLSDGDESSNTVLEGVISQSGALNGPQDLESSLKIAATQTKETTLTEWNPYVEKVEQAETGQSFPIYQLEEIDKAQKAQAISKIYGLSQSETITATDAAISYPAFYKQGNNQYVMQVNKSGSYIVSLIDENAKPVTSYSAYSEKQYRANVTQFIKKYGKQLNITKEKVQYDTVMVDGTQYVNGAYIFRDYAGASAQCLVGFYEYIYIRLSDDGVIEYINDHQTEKTVIGEFKLLGKEKVVQQYNSQNIYRVGDFVPSEPFGDNNSIWIEYAVDTSGKILQPVYFINQKDRYSVVESMCAVPAINGEVLNPDNVSDFTKPKEETPVVTPVPYVDISDKLNEAPLTCAFSTETVLLGNTKTIAMVPKAKNDYYYFEVVEGSPLSPIETRLFQTDGMNGRSVYELKGKSASISNVAANQNGIYWISPIDNGTAVSFYSYETTEVKVLTELGTKVSELAVSDEYICYRNKGAKDIFAVPLSDLSKTVSIGKTEGTIKLPTQFTDKIAFTETKDKKQVIKVINLANLTESKTITLQGKPLENIQFITVGETYIVITCQKQIKGGLQTKTYLYSLENENLTCISNSDMGITIDTPIFVENDRLLFIDQNGRACVYDINDHIYSPIQTLSEQTYQSLKNGYLGYLTSTDGKNVTMILPRSTERYEGTFFDYAPNGMTEAPSMELAPTYAKENNIADLRVYNYIAVNQQKRLAEIMDLFGLEQKTALSEQERNDIRKKHGVASQADVLVEVLTAADEKAYDVLVYPNGTYRLILSSQEEDTLKYSQNDYESFSKAFLDQYQTALGLENVTLKYRTATVGGETAVTGAYFFCHYNEKSEASIMGFREYLFATFDKDGGLVSFSNQRTQKDALSSELITKEKAIQLYQNNKAYRVNSANAIAPQPDYKVGEPVLLYTADVKGTVMQPVYYIPLLSSEDNKTVIGYAGVTATNNGDLLTGELLQLEEVRAIKGELSVLPVVTLEDACYDNLDSVPVYKVTEVNHADLASGIMRLFGLKETTQFTVQDTLACYSLIDEKKQEYDLKISKNRNYVLKSKLEAEVYDQETYAKNVEIFVQKYGEALNITKATIKYDIQVINKKEYVSGVTIVSQAEKTPIDQVETISLSLNRKGELIKLENYHITKEKIGEYKLLGVEEAIRRYNYGEAYYTNAKENKIFHKSENTISLEYAMDSENEILQPVYAIKRTSATGKQTLLALIPAYNNQVWTLKNMEQQKKNVSVIA